MKTILKYITLSLFVASQLGFGNTNQAGEVTITFNVDMNIIEDDLPSKVEIMGDKNPLSWKEGIELLDEDKDGIYTVTISFTDLKMEDVVRYKYVWGEDNWEGYQEHRVYISTDTHRTISDRYQVNYENKKSENPFKRLIGEWVIKDDLWEQSYGGKYSTKLYPNNSFIAKEVNTKNQILWVETTEEWQVTMLWIYNFRNQEIHQLSSSSTNRSAYGKGKFKENGDIELKLHFEDNCKSCYVIYSYKWKPEGELYFRAIYYENDKPSGNYYGCTFIRKDSEQ